MAEESRKSEIKNELIARAWKDENFRQKLLTDPSAALAEMGVTLPAGMEVKVHEEGSNTIHLVIPGNPGDAELSDEALDKVAGGSWITCSSQSCCVSTC